MKFKKVSNSLILGIALLITILLNLIRILRINATNYQIGTNSDTSLGDLIFRFVFVFIFSWVALYFNSNWKYKYSSANRYAKLFLSIAINAIYFLLTCQAFFFLHPILTNLELLDTDKNILYFSYGIIIIILAFIARILRFQIIVQQELVEKEMLKKEKLENELSALKNQVNPHFLFNSLNSLSSLVKENKEATTFISKLSFMYRYILQSGQKDLIPLNEELKFLQSYIHLIKIRYQEKFEIHIDISDAHLQKNIPILALQLLVENAVKHNEISVKNPLVVKVYSTENNLVIVNKIKPRTSFVDSTGNGLVNLNKRYNLLMKSSISISNSNELFKVSLPL